MKKFTVKAIAFVLFSSLVMSCNSSDKKSGTEADGTKDTTTSAKTDAPANDAPETAAPAGDPVTVTALKDLVQKDWKAVDGKAFAVKGYPVGMQKASAPGEFYLYMGDAKGDMSANFAGVFKDEMKEEVKKHKGDAVMTITGTLGTPNGMIVLKNARIVE